MGIEKLTQPIDPKYIEIRAGRGGTILMYKNARVDMKMLDDAVGPLGWKRSHRVDEQGKLWCKIEIFDHETKQWVSKEDVGTESTFEKEKGSASDAFKRAGFNWGIGRILYDMPTIVIQNPPKSFFGWYVKYATNRAMDKVTYLRVFDNTGKPRFTFMDKSVGRDDIVVIENTSNLVPDTDKKKTVGKTPTPPPVDTKTPVAIQRHAQQKPKGQVKNEVVNNPNKMMQ